MSFSRELKTNLCELRMSECCKIAECYGFMLFGQSFSAKKISLLTDNERVASRYSYLIHHCFNSTVTTLISSGKKTTYKVFVGNEKHRINILETLKIDL